MPMILEGRIVSAESRHPLADIVVTVTSPSLTGELTTVSDADGNYRYDALPTGEYTLRFDSAGDYKAYTRGHVALLEDKTYRVDAELLPTHLNAAPVN